MLIAANSCSASVVARATSRGESFLPATHPPPWIISKTGVGEDPESRAGRYKSAFSARLSGRNAISRWTWTAGSKERAEHKDSAEMVARREIFTGDCSGGKRSVCNKIGCP